MSGFDDWPRFCRERIGQDAAFLAEIEDGVAILERDGHDGPVTAEQAQGAAKGHQAKAVEAARTVEPAKKRGTNQHTGEDAMKSKNSTSSRGSTSAEYRTAKLKRDHPEIAARMASGEFKSVAAAERAARGEEPHPPRKVASTLEQLRRLWSKATAKERRTFLAEVQP